MDNTITINNPVLIDAATRYGVPLTGWNKVSEFTKALKQAQKEKRAELLVHLVGEGVTREVIDSYRNLSLSQLEEINGRLAKNKDAKAKKDGKIKGNIATIKNNCETIKLLRAENKALRAENKIIRTERKEICASDRELRAEKRVYQLEASNFRALGAAFSKLSK